MTLEENPKDAIGRKKPSPHLIPPVALLQTAQALGLGAKKYGPYNWRAKKLAATVYVSAAYRHLGQWLDGQNNDEESGTSHLAHVAACMCILMDAQDLQMMDDDRPLPGTSSRFLEKVLVEK